MRKEMFNRSSLWARMLQLLIITTIVVSGAAIFVPDMHTAAAEEENVILNPTPIAGVVLETQQMTDNTTLLSTEASNVTTVATENVLKTEYDIPSSYVNPCTGKTVEYNNRKTLEGKNKITYGVAGELVSQAISDNDGFMMLDDRYLVAIGSRFGTIPGQYFDLVLENGVIIKCIMGDMKDDRHTDATNTFTYETKCCSEFIINEHLIRDDILWSGTASDKYPAWNYPVVKIIVYEQFYDADDNTIAEE